MPSALQEHVDAFPLHTRRELDTAWDAVEKAWRDNMERYGVKLPAENTANRLWLSILWLHRNEDIHKRAISKVVTHLRPDLSGDQQVRHLKSQGWRDVGGGRGWRRIDFGGVNPDWLVRQTRRGTAIPAETWEEVKARYDYRCAWCRVREGEAHWFNSAITRLQQGHKDPARPLAAANSIPLCQYHNQAMRDTLVLNDDGFPRAVASTALVESANIQVKREIWRMLRDDPTINRR